MSKLETKTTLTPTLRFPEFSGEWEEIKFKELAKLGKEKYDPNENKTSFPDIELESIESGTGRVLKVFKSQEQKSLKSVFNNGDILYGKLRPYLKKYWYADSKGVCSTEFWVLKSTESMSKRYLYYLIQSDKFNQVVNIQFGSKMPRADWSLVSSAKFNIPAPEEQQKIASFLTTVDEWIENLKKQKEAQEKYKKGMMQKIFSQEIRFRDDNGKDYPEWEEKRLGETTLILMGQSPPSSKYNVLQKGVPLIQGNTDLHNRTTKPRVWTEEITKLCDIGDLIMTVRAPAGYVAISKHRACIGRGVCAIQIKNSFEKDFLYQFLLWYESRWMRIEQGSTFSAISGDDIRKIKINLPSIAIQQKVATLLSSIDNLINLSNQRITLAEEWKKGLMQRVFV